jgi:hypothetical protein
MGEVEIRFVPEFAFLAGGGIIGGIWLLVRGMQGYQTATKIGDTATSRIATLAAGEVQVSGVIEPAELTLVSPLQSVTCVYYAASVDKATEYTDLREDDLEERAVGFRVRDASGDIRVFPRGARWDAPTRFDDETGALGDEPPGLSLRAGPAIAMAEPERDAAIAALTSLPQTRQFNALAILGGSSRTYGSGSDRRRHYRERRLEPGDAVTIVGRALPFSDLADPAEADIADDTLAADDPEVSSDIAEAREAGLLATSPEAAWGNAAIPGFGIGRPARAPALDPAASVLPIAAMADVQRSERRFSIAPETLVLASAPGVPLLIAHGAPGAAVDRQQGRFLVGLLGAVLAIGSAMALALMVAGGVGP